MAPDKRDELYNNLINSGRVTENEIGTIDDFKAAIDNETHARLFYNNLRKSGIFSVDEIGEENDFVGSIADDFAQPATPTAQPTATAQQPRKTRYDVAQEQYEQGRRQTNATPISQTAMGSVGGYGISPTGMPVRNTQGFPQANPQPQAPAKPMAPAPRAGQWSGAPMQQTPYAPTEEEGNKSFMPIEQETDTKQRYDSTRKAQGGLIETSLADVDAKMNAAYERDRKAYGRPQVDEGDFWTRMGRSLSAAESNNALMTIAPEQISDDTRDYQAAHRSLEASKQMIDAANNNSGMLAGMRDKAFDITTWDFGITDMADAAALNAALKAYDEGKELTESQRALLDAKALEMATNIYYANDLRRGYTNGQGIVESIPYMGTFIFNPASGASKGAAQTLGKYMIKRYAKQLVTKEGSKEARKAATKAAKRKVMATQFGTRLVLDPMAAAAVTATSGAIRTTGGAIDRMNGTIKHEVDGQGNVVFAGHTDTMDADTAFAKEFLSNWIENYSEFALDALPIGGIFKAARKADNGAGRMLDKIGGFFDNIPKASKFTRAVAALEKDAQWHGAFGEFFEEIFGGILNAALVGDQTLDNDADTGVFNRENLINTAITTGVISGFFAAAKTGGYAAQRNRAKKASNYAEGVFGEQWGDIRGNLDIDDKTTIQTLKDIFASGEFTDEQKAAALRYAYEARGMQGAERFRQEMKREGDRYFENSEQSYNTGYDDATTDELRSDLNLAYTDARQTLVGLIGEDNVGVIDEDPLGMQRLYDNDPNVSDEVTMAVAEYVSAKSAWDGVQQRISDDAADRADQRRAEGERMAYKGKGDMQGAIRPLTINEDSSERDPKTGKRMKKTVYLVNGTIAIEPNGNGLSREGTDKTIYVYDPETGDTHELDPFAGAGVLEVGEPVSMEDYLANNEQQNQAEVQQEIDNATGKVNIQPNTPFVTPEGRQGIVKSVEGDNVIVQFADGEMEEASIPLTDMQQYADALRRQEYEARHPQQTPAEQPQQPNTATEGQTPTAGTETPQEGGNATTEQPQVEYPRDKQGNIDYDKIGDAATFATALGEEFGEDARATLDEIIAEETAKMKKQNAVGKARIRKRLAMLEEAKAQLTPSEEAPAEAPTAEVEQPTAQITPQAGEVPDMSVDKASDARARGYRMQSGVRYDRQGATEGVVGSETEVKFTNKEKPVKGRWKVVEAGSVQPSHIGGQNNPLHFITEAQPKDRTDKVSDAESDKIAANINPKEIIDGVTAYTGAPVVNSRGEVIQGNNRATALRKMGGYAESAARYKQYLIDHAADYGLNAEDIAKMQNPIMVREVDVTDEEAIRLGQFTASDTESGGKERISADKVLGKLTDEQTASVLNIMLRGGEETDETLMQLIDRNGADVLTYLAGQGAINDTQVQSAYGRDGRMTPEAKNDLADMVTQNIFKGGADNIKKVWNEYMPVAAQKALLQAMAGDMMLPVEDRLIKEVRNAIMAVGEIKNNPFTKDAKTAEEFHKGLDMDARQADMLSRPIKERYSELEIDMAVRFLTTKQNALKAIFGEYQRYVTGTNSNLFEEAQKMSRAESVEKTFGIKENNQQNVTGKETETLENGGGERGTELGHGERQTEGEPGADTGAAEQSGEQPAVGSAQQPKEEAEGGTETAPQPVGGANEQTTEQKKASGVDGFEFNEFGVCTNPNNIEGKDKKITYSIETAKTNKGWVGGYKLFASTYGGSNGASLNGKTYETEQECQSAMAKRLIDELKRNGETSKTLYGKLEDIANGGGQAEMEFEQTTEQPRAAVGEKEEQGGKGEKVKNEAAPKQKIDDVGEKIAGARKDMREQIVLQLADITEQALIDNPLGKVYKRPDLKKAVEQGALREKDAQYYEALFALIDPQKPKMKQADARRKRYNPSYVTPIEQWAKNTHAMIDLLREFMAEDEQGRDETINHATNEHFPWRERDLAEIESRKLMNPDTETRKHEWGDKTTPNPIWVMMQVLDKMGYKAGDKVSIPYGIISTNFNGTRYYVENATHDRLYEMRDYETVEDAIDGIVYIANLKNGDTEQQHPSKLFFFPSRKTEYGESGRYMVTWGSTLRNIRTSEFDTKEEADEFAKSKTSAYVSPIKKPIRAYGFEVWYNHPLTGDKIRVGDAEFETEEEVKAYFEENYDKINETLNSILAEKLKEKGEKKELKADDVVNMYGYYKDGKYIYAVGIDKKYANNLDEPYIVKEFDTRKEAKSFLDENKQTLFDTVLKHKEEKKKVVFFDTGENSRIGEDYRNGKDVTAEDFMNEFGFRGVQFGNWTNQEDRQMAVNQAFDAFHDLARLLGISPRAISLNGELGIAFGSRGVGGFAAHYEPREVVINLTKTRGAGSLAHEWWHALDNYLARSQGHKGGMVTSNQSIPIRSELRSAFDRMMNIVMKSDYAKRSKYKGEYWGRPEEITARLLAEWADQELKQRGELNTFLSRGANLEEWLSYNYKEYADIERTAGREPMPYEEYKETPKALRGIPYPSVGEVKEFGGLVRDIFNTLQERMDEATGRVALFHRADGTAVVPTAKENRLRDAVVNLLRKAGIEVVIDEEAWQRVQNEEGKKPMLTKDGEAYGFTMGGKIYLDPKIATAETPIHEYTHLWAAALRAANPKAWERLKSELEKDKDLMAYVQRLYPELKGDELMDEVFAHFSGRRGAERLRAEQERMEGETQSIVGKAKVIAMFENLRNALKRFWNAARELFAGKRVKNESAEDFADMVLGDLLGGVNPNNEIEAVNARFNEELEAFDKGERGNLHLGYPSRILRACGIDSTEMFIKPRVLREHLNKHGLTIEDIKDLPKAMSNPLMVYEWGTQAKSLIVITELTISDGRKITAAIKLERQGKRAEVNEIASVHGKEAEYFINEMNNAKGGGLANALRYIGDKKKVLDWLGLDPPKGSPSLTNQELSVAKILNNFENPQISRESFSESTDIEREKNRVKYQKSDNNLRFRGEEEPPLQTTDENGTHDVVKLTDIDAFTAGAYDKAAVKKLADWLKENKDTYVRLYHGTSSDNTIETEGIRRTNNRNKHSYQSQNGYVYLSIYPSSSRLFGELGSGRNGEDVSVYAVDVKVKDLLPDTDQLNNKRAWGGEEFADMGNSLAESLLYGNGARVKRDILPSETSKTLFRNLEESDNVVNNADAGTRPLTDREKIAKLESEPKVKVYRSMQLIDGKLYPPMSARVDGQLREPSEIGVWEEAEEHPELADENGKFKLDKGNKKSLKAAYNPYIHTSRTMLNDQFSEAQSRPNLVVVEVEIPESELNGTYRAEKAKDSIGAKQWKAGVIQGQLSGTREVILSRWAKPVRIVPDAEVAENIARQIEGHVSVMPSNVVTPQVRAELEKRGVRFVETDNTGRLTSGSRKGETWAQVYGKNATKQREGGEEAYAGDWYDRGSVERIGEFAGYTPKQIAKMNARQEESARKQFNETAEKLHLGDNITFADSIDDVPGLTDKQRREWRRKKGWYSPRTGKIVIILGNHKSMDDVMKSILHEGVAHNGLRQMFGKHFDMFLTNVYETASPEIRERIDEMAKRHGWDFREATEEYLAMLAEDTDFEKPENQSWWGKVKAWFFDMLHKIGFKLHDAYDTITDNELRYILWRSYENLVHPGRYNSVVEEAKDIAKQYDLKVGQWDENRADRVERNDRMGSDYNVAADGVAEDAAEYAKETERIEQEARANGTWMKAPNGKRSNLDKERWVMVRTKSFKKWFGDWQNDPENASKALDENGEPRIVYHGTEKGGFTVFDSYYSDDKRSFFFSSNTETSATYSGSYDTINIGEDATTIEQAKELVNELGGELEEYWSPDNGRTKYDSEEELLQDYEYDEGEHPEKRYRIIDAGGYEIEDELTEEEAIKKSRVFSIQGAEEQKGLYDVFLNLRQPTIVDATDQSWNEVYTGNSTYRRLHVSKGWDENGEVEYSIIETISETHSSYPQDTKKEHHKFSSKAEMMEWIDENYNEDVSENVEEGLMRDFREEYGEDADELDFEEEPAMTDYEFQWDSDAQFLDYPQTTREVAEEAYSAGDDGVIFKELYDSGPHGDSYTSDVYVVFDNKNIKSANAKTFDNEGEEIGIDDRFNPEYDDIRFRDGEDEETGAPKPQARGAYERMVSSAASQWKEAMQDSMLSLKKLYQAVSQAYKGSTKGVYRIEDEKGYENAYLAENRMHSMSEAQIHAYQQDYMKPLQRAIHALTDGKREAYETLTDYMMAKHGLERNEVMAKRDAKKAWEEQNKSEIGNPNYTATKNAVFANIDAGVDDLYLEYRKQDYAGLTALTGIEDVEEAEKEAQRMVDEYEQQHDTTDLWIATNRATRRSLFKMLESGILSPERHADIRDMYQYYIPLQGFDSDVAEDVYAYMGSDGTRLYGTTIRKAKGRKSKADDPIATIAMNGEAAIRRGNRNLMKQHFLRFVQSHPSDLVSINDVWLRKNANGEWEQYFDADLKETDTPEQIADKVRDFNERMEQEAAANPDMFKRSRELPGVPFRVLNVRDMEQHQVMVQVDGKNYLLTINGNPRAAQALNGLTNPDVFTEGAFGSIMNATQSVVRTLSQFYTTRNPNFVLSNFLRDAVYTNSMVLAKESPNYALNFHKNFLLLPNERMGVLFASWENGKLREKLANGTASNMEKMFYDFMMNGGETGWTSLRDIEKHKRDLQKALKREGNIAASALNKLGDFFDITNRMIENHARFTAYVTSIEMGRSVERAVWDAKEISVNFNKKGAGDKFLKAKNQTFVGKVGAFVSGLGRGNYAFWNASLQGLNNIARIGKRNPAKFMAVATTLMGLGVAIPLLNALLGGDDDDDKNAYWNLPEYVRRSNICFRFTKDMPWITIPLPIEFRAIYGLGELGSGVALGKEYYSKGELTKQVAAQFSQVLPLDFMEGGGGWHCLYPTYIKPVIEAYSNQSWTGLPIYRKNTYGQYDVAPEWQRAYSNTNNQIMAATKWLNEATGGDEVQGGNIDFNPARIEYMLRGYLGGYFTVADQVIKMGETATGNREFEWRNMMLANRVVKEGDERTEARKLTNEYFNLKEEYDKTYKSLKAYKKKQDEGTLSVVGQAHYIALMNDSEEYGRYLVFGTYKPLFDAYYKQIKEANAAGDSEEAKRLERGQNELRREMVNIIHDMDNGGTFDRKKVATGINENIKKMQNDKLWEAQDKAINKSIEADNALNPTDNVEE